jgi:molecular chaperone GrpE (heat shock protein)
METIIKNKITKFTAEMKEVKPIKLGSDEHLDAINIFLKPISKFTLELATLNKNLSAFLNTETKVTQKDIELLKSLASILNHFYAIFKRSEIYPFVKLALSEFDDERQLTKEIIHDFKEYRTDSSALKKATKKLKSL